MEAKINNNSVSNANVSAANFSTVPPVPETENAKETKSTGSFNGLITGIATGVGALVGATGGAFAANAINRPSQTEENIDESDICVIGYDHVTTEMDVVTVKVDDIDMYLADTDMDGIADTAYVDVNADGIITSDECVDITEDNISMVELADLVDNLPAEPQDNNVDVYVA